MYKRGDIALWAISHCLLSNGEGALTWSPLDKPMLLISQLSCFVNPINKYHITISCFQIFLWDGLFSRTKRPLEKFWQAAGHQFCSWNRTWSPIDKEGSSFFFYKVFSWWISWKFAEGKLHENWRKKVYLRITLSVWLWFSQIP